MKWFLRIILTLLTAICFIIATILFVSRIDEPEIGQITIDESEIIRLNDTTIVFNDSWLRKNKFGLWEMYISGNPIELGLKNGVLAQELIKKQEQAFVKQIKKMIPSESYLNFLKYITSFMNHNLPDYIPQEYLNEIKAVSLFASSDFSIIGDNYARQLNYHAAHDIGHAMQNLHLVECTAFGVNREKSSDSSLLLGRNFDFYVGDEFAENKIILFVNPEKGHPFASITWGGMIGVVSGMNKEGLCITLNSAKSDIPLFAKTPVSIIAREILQYASSIDDAYEIAKKRPSFVAESFMISSAIDKEMAIIEKTPDTTILYRPGNKQLVLTNHFQSPELRNTAINIENIEENVTDYRFQRVEELLEEYNELDELDVAHILRDSKGLKNENIGLGNEGAINQLIAHHSVIFKPEQARMWVSSKPFQLGTYVAYQLDSIFDSSNSYSNITQSYQYNIDADTVFLEEKYPSFLAFKAFKTEIENSQNVNIDSFINCNPHYFSTYELAGDYYTSLQKMDSAVSYYRMALQYFVPNKHEEDRINQKIINVLEP